MSNSISEFEEGIGQPLVDGTVSDVALEYLKIRAAKEDAESKVRDLSSALTAAEELLIRKLDEQGLSSAKVQDQAGRPTHLTATTYTNYRLPDDGVEGLKVWVVEHGGAPLIRESILWQQFEAFCRELVDRGEPLPETVKVSQRRLIRVRRD